MGRAFKFQDNIDTDAIIAARYLNVSDFDALKIHCMEDVDDSFAKQVKSGDFIVAGENFGCGSSREHAPAVIKACGVSAVIAASFARIFYRNAINIGLAIIECGEAAKDAENGDEIAADLSAGIVKNVTKNKTYSFPPFPEEIREIINRGGLL